MRSTLIKYVSPLAWRERMNSHISNSKIYIYVKLLCSFFYFVLVLKTFPQTCRLKVAANLFGPTGLRVVRLICQWHTRSYTHHILYDIYHMPIIYPFPLIICRQLNELWYCRAQMFKQEKVYFVPHQQCNDVRFSAKVFRILLKVLLLNCTSITIT